MASHVKKKRQDYNRKYYQKLQYKRVKSESFNSEYIRKQNARQQKCRRLKTTAQKISTNSTELTIAAAQAPSNTTAPPTVRTILRKAEGILRRRANTRKMKNKNEKLSNEVKVLRKENSKLKRLLSQQHSKDSETNDITPAATPTKLFIDNVSTTAKKRATKRLLNKKENLPRGSLSKLRKKLGINLSNNYNPPSSTPSILQKDIEEFLLQDDVTKQAPDKKKQLHGKQIRYLLNHLSTIHQRFMTETGNNCHYSTFTRYVPDFIVKPSVNDWGTCLCAICINPQMKLEKLQNLKSRHSIIKTVLIDGLTDITELVTDEIKTKYFINNLATLKHEQFNITYSEWVKKKNEQSNVPISTKTTITSSMADFVNKFVNEIENLTHHIDRVRQQFRAAKQAKQMAIEQDDTVTIHLDWSENFNLKQARQEKDMRIVHGRPRLPQTQVHNYIITGKSINVPLSTGFNQQKCQCQHSINVASENVLLNSSSISHQHTSTSGTSEVQLVISPTRPSRRCPSNAFNDGDFQDVSYQKSKQINNQSGSEIRSQLLHYHNVADTVNDNVNMNLNVNNHVTTASSVISNNFPTGHNQHLQLVMR
ncbi:unnamed protein product [Adineta steineri]|uniref:Uncharacterized protein n=1 Tax=Adineta steineri TaxID=433720 RepID=A0A815Y2K0_9BILA|nr:unnamed protein product [Adineta steineri]CAF1565852.1 unnamed protein product [Adineta steineri]